MQDLGDPAALISQAFRRLKPPEGPFDPDGSWSHVYHDISSFNLKQVQGEVALQHRAGGPLRIESFRTCPDGYRYYTIAELACSDDSWHTPTSWRVESKVARTADAPAYLHSGLTKRAEVTDGVLTLQAGEARRRMPLSGPHTCKWCLLDAVGRLSTRGTQQAEFTLMDEYDTPCPGQTLAFGGKHKTETRSGVIEVCCYQHTGTGSMPGVFYVDGAGRVLFYLAGMELLALASVDGEATGYLT